MKPALEKCKLLWTVGDPLVDVTQLEHVQFVMKGGEVVRNALVKIMICVGMSMYERRMP
jgi:hypothetical protein